jgi:hypothetical protein
MPFGMFALSSVSSMLDARIKRALSWKLKIDPIVA